MAREPELSTTQDVNWRFIAESLTDSVFGIFNGVLLYRGRITANPDITRKIEEREGGRRSAQKTAKSERLSVENLEAGCIIITACHAAP